MERLMANSYYWKAGKRYRVDYSLKLADRYKRKVKYTKSPHDARALTRQVERVESATRTATARSVDIEQWVELGYITTDEAAAAFPGWGDSVARQSVATATDYDAIYAAYETYAWDQQRPGSSDKSVANALSHTRRAMGWLRDAYPDLRDITAEAVQRYHAELLASGSSEWTAWHRVKQLRLVLDMAIKLTMVEVNVARELSLPAPKNKTGYAVLSLSEITWLLDTSLEYRQWITGGIPTGARLGLYAGLRPREMTLLEWEGINATSRIITVMGAKQGGARRLDVKAPLIDYLTAERQRQEELGVLGQWVLVGGSETQKDFRLRPLGQDSLGAAWAKMISAERAKRQPAGVDLDHILPYSLRHTYCTELLRAGVDIRTVQARMDHARLSTTQRYLAAIEAEQHPTDALPY